MKWSALGWLKRLAARTLRFTLCRRPTAPIRKQPRRGWFGRLTARLSPWSWGLDRLWSVWKNVIFPRTAQLGIEPLEDRVVPAVQWDGGGDGTSWTDRFNWLGDAVPGTADDVVINVTASPTVRVDGGAIAVRSLDSRETLEVAGGSLTTTNGLTQRGGLLSLAGGTVAGPVTMYGGNLNITSGSPSSPVTIFGDATLTGTIPAGQTVTGFGNWDYYTTLFAGAGLVNRGTIRLETDRGDRWSQLSVPAGREFRNADTGQVVAVTGPGGGGRYLRGRVVNEGAIKTEGWVGFDVRGSYVTAGGRVDGNVFFVASSFEATAAPAAPTTLVMYGDNTLLTDNPANTTLRVQGDWNYYTTLFVANNVTNAGTIRLASDRGDRWAQLSVNAGKLLTNTGAIESQNPGGINYVQGDVTNTGGLTVESGGRLRVNNVRGTFTHAGGSIAQQGNSLFSLQGTFRWSGGSISGFTHLINTAIELPADGTGTGRIWAAGDSTLNGTIQPGQNVTIFGNWDYYSPVRTTTGLVNKGTLRLETDRGDRWSQLIVDAGQLFTNEGAVESYNPGGINYVQGDVRNTGSVTNQRGELRLNHTRGTFTHAGGSISNQGVAISTRQGGFVWSGGSTSGFIHLVTTAIALPDDGTGTGTVWAAGDSTLNGTIQPGQTVTAFGNWDFYAPIVTTTGLTVEGTLRLETDRGDRWAQLTVPAGVPFVVAPGGQVVAGTGAGGGRYLRGRVVNQGTVKAEPGVGLDARGTYVGAGGVIQGNVYFIHSAVEVTAAPPTTTTVVLYGDSTLLTDNLPNTVLQVQSNWDYYSTLTVSGNRTNAGVIRLAADRTDRWVQLSITGALTNTGVVDIAPQPGGREHYFTGTAPGTGFNHTAAGQITGFGTVMVNANLAFDARGPIDPDVRLQLPDGGLIFSQASAARPSVAAIPGDGVAIELFNQIGGGRAPAPSDLAGRTPSGATLSPYLDFPNPGSVVNVGTSFNAFFATTATPPAQVSGLSAANFILRNTFYLSVSPEMDTTPSTPAIDLTLAVGSDDGFDLRVGSAFVGNAGDRGFTVSRYHLAFGGAGLYPVTLLYAANAAGQSGLELRWTTALTGGEVIVPQRYLYTTAVLGDRLITFEEAAAPLGTRLTDQFRGEGVLFNTLGGDLQVTNVNPTRFVPVSGTRVYADPTTNPSATGELELTFVIPGTTTPGTTDFVSLYLIDAEAVAGARVRAWDPENNLVFDQSYSQGAGTQQRVAINHSRIARVRVALGTGADTAAIDNLSFNTPVRLNHLPVIDPIPDQTLLNTAPLNLTVRATDPDPDQTVGFSLDPGSAPGARIDPFYGVITWTPTQAQVPGTYDIIVRATDSGAPQLSVTRTFKVFVLDTVPPAVTQVTPTGPVSADVSSFQVTFSEAVDQATVSAADFVLTIPGGTTVAPTAVTRLGPAAYRVDFPTQSTEGAYTLTTGPAITDPSGNPMAAAHSNAVTIDKGGPRVVDLTPTAGSTVGLVTAIVVTFDEPITLGTLSGANVSLVGPGGAVALPSPTSLGGNRYQFALPAGLRTNGRFDLAVGPAVTDLAGNRMDQDQDGVRGEAADDKYTAFFIVALPDLSVRSVTPPTGAVYGAPFDVTWVVGNEGTAAVPADWADDVYLSKDTTLDGSDTKLVTHGGARPRLAPGEAEPAVTRSVSVPSTGVEETETYYLIVLTNPGTGAFAEATGLPNQRVSAAFTIADTTPATVASVVPAPGAQVPTDVTRVTVVFRERIDAATFTAADVSVTDPAGNPVDTTGFTVTPRADGKTFDVDLPALTAEGQYTVSVGPAIQDRSGNPMAAAYTFSFVLDKTGPRVTAVNPQNGATAGLVTAIEVTFSEPITLGTLSGANVSLVGPGGAVALPSPTSLGGNRYQFAIPAGLRLNGSYQLAVGPAVTDQAGNRMDQDQDGVKGEATEDVFGSTFTVTLPDLVALTAAPVTSNPFFDDPFEFTWTVKNVGTASVTAQWTDKVYLSANDQIDAGDVLLATYSGPNRPLLGPDQAEQLTRTFTLPFDGTQTTGQYRLIVQTDTGDTVEEASPGSNLFVSDPFQVTRPSFPDLVVTAVAVDSALLIADPATVRVTWTVKNQGPSAGKVANWHDWVILDEDPTTTPTPRQVVIAKVPHSGSLAAGAEYTQTAVPIVLPGGLTGRFTLSVRTDGGSVVPEDGQDGNNTRSRTGTVDVMPVEYADLRVTAVTPSAPPTLSGQPFPVTWRVENKTDLAEGGTNRGDWLDAVYLATKADGTGQVPGSLMLVQHFGFLDQDGFYEATGSIPVPDGLSGTFYVVVETGGKYTYWTPDGEKRVEGGPFEFLYGGNNKRVVGPVTVTRAPEPNLKVASVAAPAAPEEGSLADFTWTVTNAGAAVANGTWEDVLFLERTLANNQTEVVELGRFQRTGPLAVGGSYTRTEAVRVPSFTNNVYRVKVRTDATGAVFESNEADNTTEAPNTAAVQVKPRPDLRVQAIEVSGTFVAEQLINVAYEVVNQGARPIEGVKWEDRVYLSIDPTISDDDVLVGKPQSPSALAVNEPYRVQLSGVPIPKRFGGQVFVIVATDFRAQVEEWPNETNNVARKEITVTGIPFPDLVVTTLVSDPDAFYDQPANLRYVVTNKGAGPTDTGTWTDTIWLTKQPRRPNPAPSQGDILLKVIPRTGNVLAVNGSYENVVQVQLPSTIPSGQWYFTAWADTYDVVTENTYTGYINPNDPNEFESNNYKSNPVDLGGNQPDLVVQSVEVERAAGPGEIKGGDRITVRWVTKNAGGAPAYPGGWGDRVYLSDSPDPKAKTARTLFLGELKHFSPLDAHATYQAAMTFDLSPSASGKYVVVIADDSRSEGVPSIVIPGITPPPNPLKQFVPVVESDETNNAFALAKVVTPIPGNLRVTGFEFPPQIYSGEPVTIKYTVTNDSDTPLWVGTQAWKDYLWLSSDAVFDRNRASFLGTAVYAPGPLGAHQSIVVTFNARIPEGADAGTYYLHVHLDAHNDLSPLFYPSMARQMWKPGYPTEGGWPGDVGENDDLRGYFTGWAFEDITDNLTSTPVPVVYKEADLRVTDFHIVGPSPGTAGGTVRVAYTVKNFGERDTRVGSWTDRIFISRDGSLSDLDHTLIDIPHAGGLAAGASYPVETEIRLPDGISGDFRLILFPDAAARPDQQRRLSDIGFNLIRVEFDTPARWGCGTWRPSSAGSGPGAGWPSTRSRTTRSPSRCTSTCRGCRTCGWRRSPPRFGRRSASRWN